MDKPDELDSAEVVCNLALQLIDEEGDLAGEEFQSGFLETNAYIRGRRVTPKGKLSQYRSLFKSRFPFLSAWLCPRAVELPVQAEALRDLLPNTQGIDWATCVVQCCRALEAELRAGIGHALVDKAIPLQTSLPRTTLGQFAGLLGNKTAIAAVSYCAPQLREFLGDALPGVLDSVGQEFRNASAHPGPRMGPEHALKLRRWLLEEAGEGGLGVLWKLAEFSKARAEGRST